MSWQDIYFSRCPSTEEIMVGLGKLFKVEPELVLVQSEYIDLADLPEEIQVVCGSFSRKGSFPVLLEIIPLHLSLIPHNTHAAVGALCETFGCYAIINYDGDRNPYTSTLVKGIGKYQKVVLDGDLLDLEEQEQIEIVEYHQHLQY